MRTHQLIAAASLLGAGLFTIILGNAPDPVLSNNPSAGSKKTITEPVVVNASKAENETLSLLSKRKSQSEKAEKKLQHKESPKCVFKTAFEGVGLEDGFYYKIPGRVQSSIDHGLEWLAEAQQNDGGWGAGSHRRQDVMDPHSVQSDPATTAIVAMSINRSGSTLNKGEYSRNLKKALMFLIEAVEESDENSLNITTLTYTQPQSKLGQNIDVVLTSQFLGNIIHDLDDDPQLKRRVRRAIQKCVDKIEMGQSANGSQKGSGWAGVLQSSFAVSALESAQVAGVEVEEETLERSRDFQKNNINPETNDIVTESAAGVVLYSVSGSTRATAKETAEVKQILKKAKAEGKIKDEEVSLDNLQKAGVDKTKAMKYKTAYNINNSAKKLAQDDNVMTGFGNNGGEEFLSYLQTGEGLIMSHDNSWTDWYDKMSGRLLKIQNNNGSWNGHHCITSPVFCTATCILILSVNNDIDKLTMNEKLN